MTIRTSKTTVTFAWPFELDELDEVLPAGAYEVETDEELLEGVSFPAYRRISTLIHLHASSGNPRLTRTLAIDPTELDAALARDQASAGLRNQTGDESGSHAKANASDSSAALDIKQEETNHG